MAKRNSIHEDANDELERAQTKGLAKKVTNKKDVKEYLANEGNKQGVMDYIFGKTEVNPLNELRG